MPLTSPTPIEAFEQATIEATIEAAGRIQAGVGGSPTVDPPDDDD